MTEKKSGQQIAKENVEAFGCGWTTKIGTFLLRRAYCYVTLYQSSDNKDQNSV